MVQLLCPQAQGLSVPTSQLVKKPTVSNCPVPLEELNGMQVWYTTKLLFAMCLPRQTGWWTGDTAHPMQHQMPSQGLGGSAGPSSHDSYTFCALTAAIAC